MNYIVLAICLILLGITTYLELKGKPTLSQQYQKIFPTWLDVIFFAIGILGLTIWRHYCSELHIALYGYMCGFWGHVTFPNKERYEK